MLIIDPIFRASRLYVTWLVAKVFNQKNEYYKVITREEFETEQLKKDFKIDTKVIISKVKLRKDIWYKKLLFTESKSLLNQIKKYGSKNEPLFITGWNELLPYFPLLMILNYTLFKNRKIVAIDYSTEFLFSEDINFKKRMKYNFKKAFTSILLKLLPNLMFLGMDDRLKSNNIKRFQYLPDIAPIFDKSKIDKLQKINDKIKITTVGTQTKRKGIDDIINLIAKYGLQQNIELNIVGKFDECNLKFKNDVKKYIAQGVSLKHIEKFVTEEELQYEISSSDYIILPYSKEFFSSSGVMSYAMYFGVPLVATDHGVLGYRVKNYSLGFVYKANNIEQLNEVFKKISSLDKIEYNNLTHNCKKYCQENNFEYFSKVVEEILL